MHVKEIEWSIQPYLQIVEENNCQQDICQYAIEGYGGCFGSLYPMLRHQASHFWQWQELIEDRTENPGRPTRFAETHSHSP